VIVPRRDPEHDLTTFVCTGTPTPREVEAQLSIFYAESPTLHTIWDYTGADLSALTAERISQLASFLKGTAHSRAGGRSALVFAMTQLIDISDRLPQLAELEIEQGTIKIFDGLEKAHTWITG
jgi:hypothetical protein